MGKSPLPDYYRVGYLQRVGSAFWQKNQVERGAARNMKEEFEAYGLPLVFLIVVGFLKLCFAGLLVTGIWVAALTKPAAIGIALLMFGAVLMHFKINDPVKKSLPAISMLVLSLIVIFA